MPEKTPDLHLTERASASAADGRYLLRFAACHARVCAGALNAEWTVGGEAVASRLPTQKRHVR
jgi:hypothetical protein